MRLFSPYAICSLLALLLLSGGCASRIQHNTIVLEYTDFGPQAMAYPLLGPKRTQWAPDTPVMIGAGHLYVVVYQDVALARLEKAFSADQARNIDYKFVEKHRALEYLNTQIAHNLLSRVTHRLVKTRQAITSQLGD